jgi:hypothetical protein
MWGIWWELFTVVCYTLHDKHAMKIVVFYFVENLLFLNNFIKNALPSATNFKEYLKNIPYNKPLRAKGGVEV